AFGALTMGDGTQLNITGGTSYAARVASVAVSTTATGQPSTVIFNPTTASLIINGAITPAAGGTTFRMIGSTTLQLAATTDPGANATFPPEGSGRLFWNAATASPVVTSPTTVTSTGFQLTGNTTATSYTFNGLLTAQNGANIAARVATTYNNIAGLP